MTGISGHRAGNFVLNTRALSLRRLVCGHMIHPPKRMRRQCLDWTPSTAGGLHGVNSLCLDVGCGLEFPVSRVGGAYGGDNALALGRASDLRPTTITGMPVQDTCVSVSVNVSARPTTWLWIWGQQWLGTAADGETSRPIFTKARCGLRRHANKL